MDLENTHPPTRGITRFPGTLLVVTTRATTRRVPVAHGKEVKCLETGQVPDKPLEARQHLFPLSKHSPHIEPQSSEVGCPTLASTLGSSPFNLTGALRQAKQLYLIHRNKHREATKLRR